MTTDEPLADLSYLIGESASLDIHMKNNVCEKRDDYSVRICRGFVSHSVLGVGIPHELPGLTLSPEERRKHEERLVRRSFDAINPVLRSQGDTAMSFELYFLRLVPHPFDRCAVYMCVKCVCVCVCVW
jgi:hypothetical protein